MTERRAFDISAGTRERGRIRESAYDDKTTVAVVDDDGNPVTASAEEVLSEILLCQRAIVLGLSILTKTDLINEI